MRKDYALSIILEHFGWKKNEITVFRNDFNDLSMLGAFPQTYATCNVVKEAKQAASALTLSNDQDGVAVILEEIIEKISD
ncbi:HAD hydrolase family protein [Gracilibacillus sp. S3-1-1]|uniref:HAD hydrolase family protein n=1 Tax=Gracilibacillus pellucidus TaxID=3095368 RepID=A0ACC6M6I3_9BACI|nr:HAD hydrolase family protein [Gracilibacillus sp. S3-1-1]MDX8046564.1 HAD hydrolase family protein [Gracilibacillus sp. S3-1-1]